MQILLECDIEFYWALASVEKYFYQREMVVVIALAAIGFDLDY